jgi:hypothetical protein
MKENCIMKVEFSYRNYALFSRYGRVKVHTANPDSNLAALNHAAEWCRSPEAFNYGILVQNHETEIERVQGLSRKLRNTVFMCQMRRGGPRPKSPSPIRAAECFWPLRVFMGVESRRKIETGLERGQGLSRKLRNTVLMCKIWINGMKSEEFSLENALMYEKNFLLKIPRS